MDDELEELERKSKDLVSNVDLYYSVVHIVSIHIITSIANVEKKELFSLIDVLVSWCVPFL